VENNPFQVREPGFLTITADGHRLTVQQRRELMARQHERGAAELAMQRPCSMRKV